MSEKFYQSQKTDIWLTPPDIINALGNFDLDPCCPKDLPWKTATRSYDIMHGEDGLSLNWDGRIWLNHPYSNWGDWLKKLKQHGSGIALIFARTETKAFFDHIWHDAHSILFLKKRVKFVRQDLTSGSSSTAPSVLISYSENDTTMLEKSGLEGRLIKL